MLKSPKAALIAAVLVGASLSAHAQAPGRSYTQADVAYGATEGYRGVIAYFEDLFETKLAKQRVDGAPAPSVTPARPPEG